LARREGEAGEYLEEAVKLLELGELLLGYGAF